jgi:hypothetical protein
MLKTKLYLTSQKMLEIPLLNEHGDEGPILKIRRVSTRRGNPNQVLGGYMARNGYA